MRSGDATAPSTREFDSSDALRQEITRRLKRPLTDAEWGSIAPTSHAPYDRYDLRETLAKVRNLPAERRRVVLQLTIDVQRLRALTQELATQDTANDEQMKELQAWFLLARLTFERVVVASADSRITPNALVGAFTQLGRILFQRAAADWLADRHDIAPERTLALLRSEISVDDALAVVERRTRRVLPQAIHPTAAAFSKMTGAWETGYKEGIASVQRDELNQTDSLLTDVDDWLHGEVETSWETRRCVYSEFRARLVQDSAFDRSPIRAFDTWRAFRVATQRALVRRERLAAE
jgi:hypothetical protein